MGFWVFDSSESNSIPNYLSTSSSTSAHNNGDDDVSVSNTELSINTCSSVANYKHIDDVNDDVNNYPANRDGASLDTCSSVASCKRTDDMNSQMLFQLGFRNDGQMIQKDGIVGFDQQNQIAENGSMIQSIRTPTQQMQLTDHISRSNNAHLDNPDDACSQSIRFEIHSNVQRNMLQIQDSFGKWMNRIIADSHGVSNLASSVPEQLFVINGISHMWAFSTETTKIVITGCFNEPYLHLTKSNLFCVCGDTRVRAEIVQSGVYRCWVSPHSAGFVNLFLSLDGIKPISQVLKFEYRSPHHDPVVSSNEKPDYLVSSEDKPNWEEFKLKMRLAHLLFSTSKTLDFLTSKVSPTTLKDAKKFAHKTSNIAHSWAYLMKSVEDSRVPFAQAKDVLFELGLKNMLKEWLLERVIQGSKSTEHDNEGQGVIHLCAILGYTWAVYLFSWSGLSLNFRDKHGWTALHWAAYYGREKMVAVLLSVGAKANLVTDPTTEDPGGCTAADLASANGYDGLAAYLSEKSLVHHFKDMSIAGNVSGSLQTSAADSVNSPNLSEEELYLRDTLAAYRTAADAAARIQAALRKNSLKLHTTPVKLENPEDKGQNIVAASKIQHAFRNFETRKKIAAASRIQHRYRTWKIRKEFLNIRQEAVKIQAAFRGYKVRKQYRKLVWSVGVIEKNWMRKVTCRRCIDPTNGRQGSDPENYWLEIGQKQAEERVERSVIQVQAMFRSKKAQEEYRRTKLAHEQAKMEMKSSATMIWRSSKNCNAMETAD